MTAANIKVLLIPYTISASQKSAYIFGNRNHEIGHTIIHFRQIPRNVALLFHWMWCTVRVTCSNHYATLIESVTGSTKHKYLMLVSEGISMLVPYVVPLMQLIYQLCNIGLYRLRVAWRFMDFITRCISTQPKLFLTHWYLNDLDRYLKMIDLYALYWDMYVEFRGDCDSVL